MVFEKVDARAKHVVDETTSSEGELFLRYHPEIAKPILDASGPDLLDKLAPRLRALYGSTRKFCDFIQTYLPEPPPLRPPLPYQVSWNQEVLAATLRLIYDHRSRALHDGTPFPQPMCKVPPKLDEEWPAPVERPWAMATSTLQGAWLQADRPMHLHIFAHIVRGVLLKWWDGLLTTHD